MHALLVTRDERVITEFQKIAAVTQTPLVIESEPNAEDLSNAYRVFVASDCAQVNVNHPEIVLVVIGATGPETWRLAAKLSANHIAVIPDSRDWLVAHLSAPVTKKGLCVAVIPGSGGAGASLLSVGLAFHARQLFSDVVLVDLDESSAGLDIVFGIETQPGMRWQDFHSLTGSISGSDILRGLPARDGVALLTHNDSKSTAEKFVPGWIIQQLRGVSGLVIIDFPRFTNQIAAVEILQQCDVAFVVSPSTVRGSATTKIAISKISKYVTNTELVIRSLPGTNLDALRIAQSLDAPLAGVVNSDSRIVEQIEQGFGVAGIHLGGFTRSLNALAQRLAQTNDIQQVA
jgi:secretion/DNA translocation related CpaE-like protein